MNISILTSYGEITSVVSCGSNSELTLTIILFINISILTSNGGITSVVSCESDSELTLTSLQQLSTDQCALA